MYPEAKSVGAWIKGGWHVALAYVVGFVVLLFVVGWHPEMKLKRGNAVPMQEAPVEVNAAPVKPQKI
jgi:hypothetical protein